MVNTNRIIDVQGLTIRYLGEYEGELATRLRRLKFQDETHWARYFAKQLQKNLPESLLLQAYRPSRPRIALIPVPLSNQRLVERGYNQSALIAASLCRGTSLRLNVSSIKRTRQTLRQSELQRKQRLSNLDGAFSSTPPSTFGQPVLLLDDILTTGATLLSVAHELERNHFRVLSAIAIAYAR